MDRSLRYLERLAASDPLAREQFIRALQRSGYNPYWIRVREVTCQKDNIYNDEELRRNRPELLRWEERGPSLDRMWEFYLHIPIREMEMIVWLGSVSYSEGPDGHFHAILEADSNIYSWDEWVQRAKDFAEIDRANWSLSRSLPAPGGPHSRTHLRTTLPPEWTPEKPISVISTSINEEYGLRPVRLPSRDFLAEEYFFSHFYEWLQNTQTEYGSRLRQACFPLNYQLPTIYQERHIWLHYWTAFDSPREISGQPSSPYPDRVAYDVGFNVKWCGDYSARFYRWSGEAGDDNSGSHMNSLSVCEVVNKDRPKAEHLQSHQHARQKAFTALQKKLKAMIGAAERWRYRVILEEVSSPYLHHPQTRGCPCRLDPYRSTWKAGMSYLSDNTYKEF